MSAAVRCSRGFPLVVLATLLAILGGCGKPVLTSDSPLGGSSVANPLPPGFALPDAGSVAPGGSSSPAAVPSMACANETHAAKQVPLDLVFLVDTSGSMYEMAGAQTKWLLTQNGLRTFLKDPRSAGLGIGLQFFPLDGDDKACTSELDCSGFIGSRNCVQKSVCTTNGQPVHMTRACDPGVCPFGGTCTVLGRCSESGAICYQVGQACPAGAGTCAAPGTICKNLGTGSCLGADYEKLMVPIGELPAAELALTDIIDRKEPIGFTPTVPAVEGTLNHLRQHLGANPGRRAALVLFTDGLPLGCDGSGGEAAVSAVILAARQGTPSIPSYVIGVFGPMQSNGRAVVNRWAAAGGTGSAIVLSPTEDLSQRFLDTLNQIRGAALPCEFTIPSPTGAINYDRVNVRLSESAGRQQDLAYVARADRCDPTTGGWYYDVDPLTMKPTRVIICPATCASIKSDPGARVDLVFGCATRLVQ